MNPSFEEHYSCDFGASNVWECKHVFNPQSNATASTPDYFNTCMPESNGVKVPYTWLGYQLPKSGNAYLGIYITASNFQEYVQIKLSTTLMTDVEYEFSFNVNLANRSRYSSDDLHVKFVSDSIVYNQMLHEVFLPDWKNKEGNYITDTIGWTKLSGNYTANGTERWMIIGCFYGAANATIQLSYPDNTESAYYFIDEVVLKEDSLFIPNVFTPNHDGINDNWSIDGEVSGVCIYNRWGRMVFSSGNNFVAWDGNDDEGSPCNTGVYYYLVTAHSKTNGTTERHKGFLTLLR